MTQATTHIVQAPETAFDPLDGPATIPAQVAASAAAFGDATFLAGEDGGRLSFLQTDQAVRRAARAFIAAGIEVGDRVAIWAQNTPTWVIACLGLQTAGAILVPVNTRFKGEEAAYILEASRARILCTVPRFLGNDYAAMLRDARGAAVGDHPVAGLPHLTAIVTLDGDVWATFLATGDSVPEATLDARIAALSGTSIADILFTSGTTGRPKGATFSHEQALGAVRGWNQINQTQAGDRLVVVNPFFHSFGYRAGWMSALIQGMTIYPIAELDATRLAATIERERITVLPGPPALFQTLLDAPGMANLSSLRIGMTGAANIPPDLARRCIEDLGLCLLLTSYGLTENTSLGTSCRIGDDYETIATQVGLPFPGTALKLVDSDNGPVPNGQAGEICVRGFTVMQGYFEDAAATAEAIDADGWLHTGDVGILDDRGYLRVVDRLKDIVIVGGFNAYPAEIETLLRQAPGVAEAAVVAMPDHRMGEVCAAFVVPASGATLDPADLTRWSRANMANFKVPRRFFIIDALPRTPLGKVQRFLLRQRAAAADAR